MAVKLHLRDAEVPPVSYRRQLVRYLVLVLVLVALAAGTTTATRWMPWSPLDSCLFCGGSNAATPTAPRELAAVAATTGPLAGRLGHSVNHAEVDLAPSALPTEMSALTTERTSSQTERSNDWQPWGHATNQRSDGGNNASLLSGLSRLSSSTISGGGSAVRPSVETTHVTVASEHADAPSLAAPAAAAPTPRGSATTTIAAALPPGPGGFSPSTPTSAAALTPNPTGTFHEQDNPPPTPFVPPPPVGALNANDPGGSLPVHGSSTPSPTPEPASVLLLATGVAAVFGELRRRRVM